MSKDAITKVVQRAISDAGFRRQLSTDPTGALRGFDLSADETAALRAGDAGRLSALGVDQRMSKAFALGGATVGASRTAGSDLSNASAAMASDASAAANARGNALVSDNLSEGDAMISDGGASMRGVIPTDPHLRNADADGGASVTASAINDDPGGLLAGIEARAAAEHSARLLAINEDPDGIDAANARAAAEAESATKWANDDPDNFLAASDARAAGEGIDAANARADVTGSASGTPVEDSEGYLTSIGYDASGSTSSAVTDAHDRGDGARVSSAAVTDTHDRGGGNVVSDSVAASAAGGETAFLDDSESYLSPIGSDSGVSTSAVTDAHDRGDDNTVTRIDDGDDAGGTSAAAEDGPNISS